MYGTEDPDEEDEENTDLPQILRFTSRRADRFTGVVAGATFHPTAAALFRNLVGESIGGT